MKYRLFVCSLLTVFALIAPTSTLSAYQGEKNIRPGWTASFIRGQLDLKWSLHQDDLTVACHITSTKKAVSMKIEYSSNPVGEYFFVNVFFKEGINSIYSSILENDVLKFCGPLPSLEVADHFANKSW